MECLLDTVIFELCLQELTAYEKFSEPKMVDMLKVRPMCLLLNGLC